MSGIVEKVESIVETAVSEIFPSRGETKAASSIRELLIGCGYSREKKLYAPPDNAQWHHLTTLDINPDCKPDVVHDLNVTPYPFQTNEFDEIHAFEVLEHCGRQGDYELFFAQFSELWRVIKPGGLFFASVPMWNSPWAWGDPSHTRIIGLETLTFLAQKSYADQLGKTAISDYRRIYHADWELAWESKSAEMQYFALKAIKP